MSEMGDSYDPGPWKGYDFNKARIDQNAGRGYASPSASDPSGRALPSRAGKTLDELVPASLATGCKSPLVIITDGTGSMGDFPQVIFGKLPLLDLGIGDYLDDCEMSFAMVGDAEANDQYPLQVQPFAKGTDLAGRLSNLIIEKMGGGNETESYELAALYYARNVSTPKAVKPMLVYICDEGITTHVDPGFAAAHARTDLSKRLATRTLFDELKRKYSVYCIRKHYGNGVSGDTLIGSNKRIHEQWQEYLGADHIAILNDPKRVVDVIFGLVAYETGREDFFDKEINHRQTPEQVKAVKTALKTVTKKPAPKQLPGAGRSVMKRPLLPGGKTPGK